MRCAVALVCLLLSSCASRPIANPPFTRVRSSSEAWWTAVSWKTEDSGQHAWATVGYTGSMRPLLQGGELLLLERYAGRPLVAGELVVFDRGDERHVIHRVVCAGREAIFCMGDNNRVGDGWRPLSAVQYTVASVVTCRK